MGVIGSSNEDSSAFKQRRCENDEPAYLASETCLEQSAFPSRREFLRKNLFLQEGGAKQTSVNFYVPLI